MPSSQPIKKEIIGTDEDLDEIKKRAANGDPVARYLLDGADIIHEPKKGNPSFPVTKQKLEKTS